MISFDHDKYNADIVSKTIIPVYWTGRGREGGRRKEKRGRRKEEKGKGKGRKA